MAANKLTAEEKAARKREYDRLRSARLRASAWYTANQERARETRRAYREAHREDLLAKKRAYTAAHREEDCARACAWAKANPERRRKTAREWARLHPEQNRVNSRVYYERHQDEIKARHRVGSELHARHPMRGLIKEAKSRAKKRGLVFDGLSDIANTKPAECCCCGASLDYSKRESGRIDRSASLDRVDSTLGYTNENVRVICWRCNRLKSDATLNEMETIVAYIRFSLIH